MLDGLIFRESYNSADLTAIAAFDITNAVLRAAGSPILAQVMLGKHAATNLNIMEAHINSTSLALAPIRLAPNLKEMYDLYAPLEASEKVTISTIQDAGGAQVEEVIMNMSYLPRNPLRPSRKTLGLKITGTAGNASFGTASDTGCDDLDPAKTYQIEKAYAYGTNLEVVRISHPDFNGYNPLINGHDDAHETEHSFPVWDVPQFKGNVKPKVSGVDVSGAAFTVYLTVREV